MSTVIDPDAVRNAVNIENLQLDKPRDLMLQQAVHAHFPDVFDTWAATGTVDPYDSLAEDGVRDENGLCIPPGVEVSSDRGHDIFSACAHTIRRAVERVYRQDPCSSASDLTF